MYYPIMLDLKNKNVLIVGGGNVAYRKIKNLIKAGANITVLSLEFIDQFKNIQDLDYYNSNVEFIKDEYKKEYLKDLSLVIAATSNTHVNEEISYDAKELNILCNVVDNKNISDFITPSVIDNDEILISVCTNGKYPALSKYIRRDLEGKYKRYTKEYLSILEEFRLEVLKRDEADKEEIINFVLDLNIEELKRFCSKYTSGI